MQKYGKDVNDIIKNLQKQVEDKEMRIIAKDCIIKQQKKRILQLESELANSKIDADSATLELLIKESNEARRMHYKQLDFIYIAILFVGIASYIASKF